MICQVLIIIYTSSFFLHQVWANSTKAVFQAKTNSTNAPANQSSYFYQDSKGLGTYEFGYHVEDKSTENIQFRNESGFSNGSVTGTYGYLRPDGIFTIINYEADDKGFRSNRKNEIYNKQTSVASESTTSKPSLNDTSTSTTAIPGLNLTSGTLPPLLVDKVMEKFQIDLSPDASPADILHPNISDIINGKVPLKSDKNSSKLGFDVVQNFIPSNFPISPFKLPAEKTNKPKED